MNDDKRRISVEFENKKYPLLIKNNSEEEEFYRNARKRLKARVSRYRSRYSKVEDLYTQDFYIMAAYQYALEDLFHDSFMEKLSRLTERIDEYLQEE